MKSRVLRREARNSETCSGVSALLPMSSYLESEMLVMRIDNDASGDKLQNEGGRSERMKEFMKAKPFNR